jgi:hypothetical protein
LVGTLEALAVFVWVVIPGYVAVRAYEWRRPPLRHRTALLELARVVTWSALLWAVAWWCGKDVLVDLLDGRPDQLKSLTQDIYWLTAAVVGGAIAAGLIVRKVRPLLERGGILESTEEAWDRLLVRLRQDERAVILRIKMRSGGEVYGAFAERGRADWLSDGSGVLLDLEATADESGMLRDVPDSRGVYVPGEEIASVSVIGIRPPEPV